MCGHAESTRSGLPGNCPHLTTNVTSSPILLTPHHPPYHNALPLPHLDSSSLIEPRFPLSRVMSFRQSPSCRVPSPSSSPPVSFVCTPPNGSSESKLLPSPPLSASSRRSESKDLVWCALEYIHNRTSESPRLLLPNFSWAHFDDFQDELNYPRRLFGKSADSLR